MDHVGGGCEIPRGAVAIVWSGRQRVLVEQSPDGRASLGTGGERGYARVGIHSDALPQAFEGGEEERAVLADRPAQGTAEKIVAGRRSGNAVGIVEKIVGVQVAVTQKFEA